MCRFADAQTSEPMLGAARNVSTYSNKLTILLEFGQVFSYYDCGITVHLSVKRGI